MKTNLLNISLLVLLSAVSLCGCSNDDEPVVTTTDGSTLTVTARADGFAPTDGTAQTGTPQTRASESGYTTTFVKGDRIGVFAVKDGSVIADCKNLPCTYDGTAWSEVYKYTGATYFAYYPYKQDLNTPGITAASDIVAAFNTTVASATDQSTYANYTACDLMTTDDAVSPNGGTSLSFTFTHRMSLIEISLPVQEYKTSSGADAYEYSAPVLNPTFSLTPSSGSNATTIKPYPMGNGIYRYIVPAGTSGATLSGVFNTADGKTIEYLKDNLSLFAGNYKRLNVTYSGAPTTPTERALAVGDYYYLDGNIVPRDTQTPPSEGCIGVVYWVGSIIEDDPLLKRDYPGCTHGLVVALRDAGSKHWSDSYEYVQNWVKAENGNPYKDVVNLQEEDKRCGYSNTLALKDYNAKKYNSAVGSNNGYRVLPIDAIKQYAVENPAPANSSGWYFPSVMELKYVCWGQGNGQSASGKDKLNPYISKVGGTVFGYDNYWSSTESSGYSGYAWYVNFYLGSVYDGNGDKDRKAYRVRPLLAF